MNVFLGKVKKKLFGRLHFSLNHDIKNTILLAGVGRSGTTWLSDIINYNNAYRDMFEPFYNDRVPMCKPIRNKQYLRRDEVDSRVEGISEKILSGKIRNSWCDSQNKKIFSSQRILKDIRLNLMLGWIKSHFTQVPVVFIVRNPYAVALSKVKLKWTLDMDDYLSQTKLVDDFLHDKVDFIKSLNTPFERFMAQWCIEIMVPLQQLGKHDFHIVFYENICVNPKEELKDLFNYLEKDFTDEVLEGLDKPSSVSLTDSAIKKEADLIGSWKKYCTNEQLKAGMRVMRVFSMEDVYDSAGLPQKEILLNKFVD